MSFKLPEKYRKKHPMLGLGDSNGGYFVVPMSECYAHVMASNGMGWEHVSIHLRTKTEALTPEWEEMCDIKAIFWDDEDCVIQYHPPKSEYVNAHPHVLHLWRPVGISMPMPPSILVGPKTKKK